MSSVQIRDVRKSFGGFEVLHGVTIPIEDGAFVVLVGPSGCGKSTLLRMLAGLENITSGTISIGDRVVNNVQPKERDIAMVFQNYALYPHMSVYDNMAFGLKMRKVERAEIRKRVQDAADILGIRDYLARKPRQLSGGQRQRVALGRAIVRHPQVFLFDEPLSNLDAKLRVQMRVELKKLHTRLNTTAIYVTHDQVEAMTLGDRVVVMRGGLVQQVGEPLELYNAPVNRFVAGFIGSPAMNFAPVRVSNGKDGLRADNPGFGIDVPAEIRPRLQPYAGRDVIMGVRPEDLQLANGSYPPGLCFDAMVEVVEKLGPEILLDLQVGEQTMVAAVEPNVRANRGDKLRFALRPERLHFFDTSSEAAI
jgi:multiple sugar transport system ATP-binding protein